MTVRISLLISVCMFACCATLAVPSLLDDPKQEAPAGANAGGEGVTVTFLGNSTLLFSDGQTSLMVDGFVSRPNALQVLSGKIGPNPAEIARVLKDAKIDKLDAVLVGHSHYDHALDSAIVAEQTGAMVLGSESYAFIHQGTTGKNQSANLIVIPEAGKKYNFGKFVVSFVPSAHVAPKYKIQEKLEGDILSPVIPPARNTDYKCGPVFAIHIDHEDGNALVTTTVGAVKNALANHDATTVFLAIGLLGKETKENQNFYWKEVVEAVNAALIFPVHWDEFTKRLKKGRPLTVRGNIIDNIPGALSFLHEKASRPYRHIGEIDAFETVTLPRNRDQIVR